MTSKTKQGGTTEAFWINRLGHDKAAPTEVLHDDGTRIDIETDHEVIEVEWAKTWQTGVGQVLLASAITGKAPVLLLLARNARQDTIHILRAHLACAGTDIKIEVCHTGVSHGHCT